MKLNDLLQLNSIQPDDVIVLRHRPPEQALNRVLPWLAAEHHDVFNAYQQTQGPRVQKVLEKMTGTGYIASFLGRRPNEALFVGLYKIAGCQPLTWAEYVAIPANAELQKYGHKAGQPADWPSRVLWFDLQPTSFYPSWKGKLIVQWPTPARYWARPSQQTELPVLAILEDSALDKDMPEWDRLKLSWEELRVLPKRWQTILSQWRGIYYIFDTVEGKGYVGSASGAENLLGRWRNYADSGDGGNRLLQGRDPKNFEFTILQLVAKDVDSRKLTALETSWKERLHSRYPHGLNDN